MEILLLASLIPICSSAANSIVELSAADVVAEPCHRRATLHCNISGKEGLKVFNLSWIRVHDRTTLCTVSETEPAGNHSHRILCEYKPRAQLALTISHLWPSDQGKYICKLQSNRGMKHVTSEVKVQECYRGIHKNPSLSEVTCDYYGVYPAGEVHWFQQGKNVTSNSTAATSRPNHKGMYNVSSTLPAKGGSEYNCSLWIPHTGTYLTSTLVHTPRIYPYIANRNMAASLHFVGLGWYLLQTGVLIV